KEFTSRFYKNRLKNIIYKDSLNMMKKLKSEGYQIYLISASPEFYLNELYDIKEVDKIIGTRFDMESGVFSRKMTGLNCKGEEKVKRLKEVLKEENIDVDFKDSYMFSDSLSDKPLLDLVGHPYLINYKKKHDIEILKWK
ncbi:MAG: HAD-IB family hydrolase, partial [Clostridium sp.]|nr:HAD-IB family hydrolase [Clostridium sp.]